MELFKVNIVDYGIDQSTKYEMPKVPNIGDGITYYPNDDSYRRVIVEEINYHFDYNGYDSLDLIVGLAELQ